MDYRQKLAIVEAINISARMIKVNINREKIFGQLGQNAIHTSL